MSDGTAIEWTDATWNPIIGCSVVSPGCTNCYAMRLAGTRLKDHPSRYGLTIDTKAGPVWNGQVRLLEDKLREPLRWTRPRRIFVCAHADLFADQMPVTWIDKVFATMVEAPQHIYQVLTKRPLRAQAYIEELPNRRRHFACHSALDDALWPLPNLHLGVSVEDQVRADERVPILLQTPAAVHWVSAEPLLGRVDFSEWLFGPVEPCAACPRDEDCECGWKGRHTLPGQVGLDWIVAGGESGPGSRPMHPEWVREIRAQCEAAEVPFLFKQWGNWMPIDHMARDQSNDFYHPAPKRDPEAIRRCKVRNTVLHTDGVQPRYGDPMAFAAGKGAMTMFEVGKKIAGRLLDGVEHNGMPATGASR